MYYQPTIFGLLREVMGLLAAPWILRILLYYEITASQFVGLTSQEVIREIQAKFAKKLLTNPPSEEHIMADLAWLRVRGLIGESQERVSFSQKGREVASELTPAASNV